MMIIIIIIKYDDDDVINYWVVLKQIAYSSTIYIQFDNLNVPVSASSYSKSNRLWTYDALEIRTK